MIFRKPLILLAVTAFTLASASYGRSQSSQSGQSLADAARKAREQQKNEPKSAKVFTDDDLANLKGQISVVGTVPPAPAAEDSAAAAKSAPTAGAAAPAVKGEAYWRKKFADARRALADDTREADVLQREYGLKQVQFYANPNTALQQQYSRKDLDDSLAELNKKKAAVDKDNQTISDLQDQLRQAGGDAGWANEPTSNASTGSESSSGDSCDDCESDGHNAPSGASAPAAQQAAPTSGQPDQAQAPAASKQQPQ